ncbi:MAG: tripartite tricarboxylate transporter TctB family protein [Flavobacterium sp.]|nr:tripartite tricarboxylate transporter TctB family protein [Flavobacterium sp.]
MKRVFATVILIFIGFVIFYFGMPVINYGFFGLPLSLLVWAIAGVVLFSGIDTSKKTAQLTFNSKIAKFLIVTAVVLLGYVTILPLLTTLPMFRSESYRELIGRVKQGQKLSNHIAPISLNKIRVVDEPLAMLLGEKIIGSQPALGSQVEIGDFTIQKVNGELYWVAPLLHTGFFKWFNNSDGTPGYVMVSATNERDVRLVQHVNNQPLKLKYQPEAYFGSHIERHVYFSGYATTGLMDYNFEIDDQGMPFWIITKYQKKVGFAGSDATGILTINAQTGEISEYSIEDTPLWVDRIQPAAFIENQLDDWGEYVRGYWNWSNEEKLEITEGLTLVYGESHKSYWYTGLSSVGKEESTVGFVLVDTRTKETTYYNQSGATEYAAQQSAEGKVQEKGYYASLPVPYIINNIPTYVMTLKDQGGLVKMFAMVAISDYTIVGVGNTMRETLTSYKNVYNMADNRINSESITPKTTLQTVITRIENDVKNGNSFYYFTVKDHPKIFVGSSQLSNELPVTAVGDSVILSYDLDPEEVIDISEFDNLSIGQK